MPELNIDLSYWAFQTLAMMLTCFLIPRLTVRGPIPAFLTVAALGFVNSHFWSAALFLNIPDNLTLRTVLLFLANGVIFWIIVKILPGIEVKGILPALVAPIVFTICSLVIGHYAPMIDWKKTWASANDALSRGKEYLQEIQENNPASNKKSGQK